MPATFSIFQNDSKKVSNNIAALFYLCADFNVGAHFKEESNEIDEVILSTR